MIVRTFRAALLALVALAFSNVALAQGYAPVEPDTECKKEETLEECRERLCEEDETDEECQRRLEKKREEMREEKQREADEQREELEEKRERQARDQRRRQRGDDDDDDDDDDYDGGGSSSADDLLRPGTRPMFFVGAIGPEFFGLNRDYDYRGRGVFRGRGFGARGRARGKLSLDFGYHFSGDFEGPAIGASIDQSFDDAFYVFNPAFKFWWDIQPVDDYGIYIAPFAKAGYALAAGCTFSCPDHAFNLGFGVEGRVLFNDRGIALLRLAQVDTYFGDFYDELFWINVSILIGGGVTF